MGPEGCRALAADLQDRSSTLRETLLSRGLISGRGAAVLDAYSDVQRRANAFLADGCDAVPAAASGAGPDGGRGGCGKGSDNGDAAYRFVAAFFEDLNASLKVSSIGSAVLLRDPLTLFEVQTGDGSAQLLSLSLAAALQGRLPAPHEVPDCFLPAEGIRLVGGAPVHGLPGIGKAGVVGRTRARRSVSDG
jgi:hypothetical protein